MHAYCNSSSINCSSSSSSCIIYILCMIKNVLTNVSNSWKRSETWQNSYEDISNILRLV